MSTVPPSYRVYQPPKRLNSYGDYTANFHSESAVPRPVAVTLVFASVVLLMAASLPVVIIVSLWTLLQRWLS